MIYSNRVINAKCMKCDLELPNPEESGDAYNHVFKTGHPVMITTKQLVMYRGKSK